MGTDATNDDDDEIGQLIANALGDGKQVVISTFDMWNGGDTYEVSPGVVAHGNHAYTVKRIYISGGITYIDLHNPWGDQHIQLPWDQLNEVVHGLDILESLD